MDDLELLSQVVRHKQAFYPSAWARYDLAIPGSLRLSARSPCLHAPGRLSGMAVMIFGTPPSFDSILETLTLFESEVNSLTS